MNNELLRALPKVDDLAAKCAEYVNNMEEKDGHTADPSLFVPSVRDVVDNLRTLILAGSITELPSDQDIITDVIDKFAYSKRPGLRRLVNGTGIVLHTNFGRSVISREAAENVFEVATAYSNLEYDIDKAERGSRYSHVEELITRLTGTESALVVNNNAAAVMLILHGLGYGHNMVISRGELVEIGGSFRIPAIMEISGVRLKEVGCTNRTGIEDYEEAVDEETAALLKVHTSNFIISGFTKEAGIKELHELAVKKDIPLVFDLGSGELKDIDVDADVISFSADKLLGGPQAGIICGRRKYIDILKKDNLIRTLRVDKLCLAALEVTLRQYLEGREKDIPTVSMLQLSREELEERFNRLEGLLKKDNTRSFDKIYTNTQTGGGSRPGVLLDDVCLGVEVSEYSPDELAKKLRINEKCPIIGRIHEGKYLISVRTLLDGDYEVVADAINEL